MCFWQHSVITQTLDIVRSVTSTLVYIFTVLKTSSPCSSGHFFRSFCRALYTKLVRHLNIPTRLWIQLPTQQTGQQDSRSVEYPRYMIADFLPLSRGNSDLWHTCFSCRTALLPSFPMTQISLLSLDLLRYMPRHFLRSWVILSPPSKFVPLAMIWCPGQYDLQSEGQTM